MRAVASQIGITESYGWRYEGQVDQGGKYHGQGVWSWSDGVRYEGAQRKGTFHGHGTCTHPDGRVESGQWKDGYFQG